MKASSIFTALLIGSGSIVSAQPQLAGWIEACGSLRHNNFGTPACPVDEMGAFFQTLDSEYFDSMNTGVNNGAMAGGFRIIGMALLDGEVQQGRCSETAYGQVMFAADIINHNISLPENGTEEQKHLVNLLGNVIDAAASYVMKGCS